MRWWVRSTLYYANTLSWIFIVLAHWNNSPQKDMSPHSNTLSWFRANQLLFLLNAACLAEKQQMPISYSGLTRSGPEHADHCTTDTRQSKLSNMGNLVPVGILVHCKRRWRPLQECPQNNRNIVTVFILLYMSYS